MVNRKRGHPLGKSNRKMNKKKNVKSTTCAGASGVDAGAGGRSLCRKWAVIGGAGHTAGPPRTTGRLCALRSPLTRRCR